ncbi:MAG: 1-acyl-sn-glycerol-3-phosphate acyltransferase [Phycisphaerales bacterium]|nr:1-acyl-sn-glycerol-3-phosphate acyltransferase [Phycisphaerales bacterium]MCI0629824.1 1-acyl-sn-glycerol-3-phosphate acyltransferase [Phycisphaerales bacterium]MCI0675855.1 1-acyl-sn-glycerol-3-phosphate acyltransferase [Phycisphaerales bacterium]
MIAHERDRAPTAEEIESRFRSPAVRAVRPLVLGTLGAVKLVLRFGWEGRFDEDLQELDGPLILAANHCSHADTAAILGTLPGSIRHRTAVAAALDVFGADSSGGTRRRISKDILQLLVAAGFHAFAFDRFGPPLRSVRTSVQLIRNGWNLLLYPEGTRSRDGEMASFKPGVALLARFTQRPVIPVHVSGGYDLLPHGAFVPRSALAMVRYGTPLSYAPDDTPISFTAKVEDQVRQLAVRQARAAARLMYLNNRVHASPSARRRQPQTAAANQPY